MIMQCYSMKPSDQIHTLCGYLMNGKTAHSTERLLKIPKTNLKTFGERSFGYIALTIWNSLLADPRASPSLQTFKAELKTSSTKPSD